MKKLQKEKLYKISFIFFIALILVFVVSSTVSAAWGDPEIVSKLNSAFEKIRDWLIKLSTPAAAVAVGVGVFMKKFSFGDEEKMRTGKKLIKSSLISYAIILGINLILTAIQTLIK